MSLDKGISDPSVETEKNMQDLEFIAYHVDDLDLANGNVSLAKLTDMIGAEAMY